MKPAAGDDRPGVGECGAKNTAEYQNRSDEAVALDDRLADFALQVHRARPGTNVDADKILSFDNEQQLLDKRALAIAAAGGDEIAGLAAFAVGKWPPRRQAFEDLWRNGRRFIYFAPNPGTLGAHSYGDYCLIVAPTTLDAADTAIFPSDTAQTYTDDGPTVDTDRVYQEVAGWSQRAAVAVVHHGSVAAPMNAAERAQLICGTTTYMEVVTAGPLALEQIETLRVAKDLWDESEELWWKWQDNQLTDPTDEARARAYNALLGWSVPNIDIIPT